MLNWYLTDTYQYLIVPCLTDPLPVPTDADILVQINIYQYLTVTYQYLINAYIITAIFNWPWPIFKW